MIESVESHTETKIITTREGQLDALGSPFLKRVAILDDDTLLATFIKKEIDLDRPVAIGVTILERSKANHSLSWPQAPQLLQLPRFLMVNKKRICFC